MFQLEHILKDELLSSYLSKDGILCFSPKTEAEIAKDKYESIVDNIDFYTWLAYGDLSKMDKSACIYSRINLTIQNLLQANQASVVLDLGCGVGRTVYDNANLFPKSQFIGLDYSFNMLRRAKQVLLEAETVSINLSSSGITSFKLLGKKLENVQLVQGTALDLPFRANSIDVLINTFLIDRVADVPLALEQMIHVLKPGGLFVLTSPLNFQTTENWSFGRPESLIDLIKGLGVQIEEFEDNILHTEVLDGRGNAKIWNTILLCGRKRVC